MVLIPSKLSWDEKNKVPRLVRVVMGIKNFIYLFIYFYLFIIFLNEVLVYVFLVVEDRFLTQNILI